MVATFLSDCQKATGSRWAAPAGFNTPWKVATQGGKNIPPTVRPTLRARRTFFTNFDHCVEDQILRVRPSGFPPSHGVVCFVVFVFSPWGQSATDDSARPLMNHSTWCEMKPKPQPDSFGPRTAMQQHNGRLTSCIEKADCPGSVFFFFFGGNSSTNTNLASPAQICVLGDCSDQGSMKTKSLCNNYSDHFTLWPRPLPSQDPVWRDREKRQESVFIRWVEVEKRSAIIHFV